MNKVHPLREKIPEGDLTFFEQSVLPSGCRDTEGHFVYANDAYFRYFDITGETREYLLDTGATYDEIPFLVPIAKELAEHDKFVFETGQLSEAIGAVMINSTTLVFTHFKYPFFVHGEIIGTYFFLRDLQSFPVRYFLDEKVSGTITFDQPNDLITEREWEVLFMLYLREKYEDIADLFGVTVKTIEAQITSLKSKAHVLTTEELLKAGTEQGWHLFVPPRIVRDYIGRYGYHLLTDSKKIK